MESSMRFRPVNGQQTRPDDPYSGVDQARNRKGSGKQLPVLCWFILSALYLSIYGLVHLNFYSFPKPKTVSTASPGEFIEERARGYLDAVAALGDRPAGSHANEVLAVDYLLGVIRRIEQGVKPAHKLEHDVQLTSGSFTLEFLSPYTSYYDNVKNIVVKFGPASGSKDAVLVNCHYDSVVRSPAAGDDMVTCALMLETLEVLSQSDTPLKHNIVFIFNGAEENLLQASHGFITQHPWSKEVRAFVNLDSAGAGGRELLFQAGPANPWLLYTYAQSVPHPYASVFGQEVFESGIIPSDTDFRIFRDYGKIPGVDIAYINNGYVYHTVYDVPDMIQPGCMQRGGENLLAFLKALANSKYLTDPEEYRHGSVVFFDLLGFAVIMYPARIGYVLNMITVILVFIGIIRHYKMRRPKPELSGRSYIFNLLQAVGVHFVSWLITIGVVMVIGMGMTLIGRPMTFYTNQWVLFGLYVMPSIATLLCVHSYLKRKWYEKEYDLWVIERVYFDAQLLILSVLVLALTLARINTAAVICYWVIFPLVFHKYIINTLKISFREYPRLCFAIHVTGVIAPTVLMLHIGYGAVVLFIPMMGRVGAGLIPDIFIGVICALFTLILMGYQVGLVYICDRTTVFLRATGLIFFITLMLAVFTPIGFPFRANPKVPTFQRHYVFHTERTFHSIKDGSVTHHDSMMWHIPFDITDISLIKEVPGFDKFKPMECLDAPYCGMGFYIPIMQLLKNSYYLPSEPLNFKKEERPQLTVIERSPVVSSRVRITLSIAGPAHVNAYVSPVEGAQVLDWSVGDYLPPPCAIPYDVKRDTYFLYYAYGTKPEKPMQFWVDVQVPPNHAPSDPVLEVALGGHYLTPETRSTPAIEKYMAALPDFVAPIGWLVTYENWFV